MRGQRPSQDQRGVVLVTVLILALLLVSSIATFLRRATIDTLMIRNRDTAAEAEALARGGIRVATALLLADRLEEDATEFRVESLQDPWARAGSFALNVGQGSTLWLQIDDEGAQINLNALFRQGEPLDETEVFLTRLLERTIEAMPGRPEDKNYDAHELALNLIDWVDADEDRHGRGGPEDDYYQRQTPRYRAANRPLLSVDELRLIEGFDGDLVRALEPYVGVYPLVGGGVNVNTAPTWVLALLYHGLPGELRLATEDEVTALARARREHRLCEETTDKCLGVRDAAGIDPSTIFPPPTYVSDVFRVRSEARVGEIRRILEVTVDRSIAEEPRLLTWRML